MKDITVSIDEETHRLARVRAAELDTSVSALFREYLRELAGDDSPQDDSEAHVDRSKAVAKDVAVRRHVQQLYEKARVRAEAVAGHSIRDVQELVEFRRGLLKKVASDFRAKGIGISMPGIVNREEMYDRSRARLEAMLVVSEERGEELEGELTAFKARIENTGSSDNAF